MTLAERLKNFEDRGFRAETAAVLVLIEEAVHSLFTSFTDTFVLFGGATLVLFYGSQRHSGDIDLLPNCDETPKAERIIDSISPALGEVAQAFGLALPWQSAQLPIVSIFSKSKWNRKINKPCSRLMSRGLRQS
jgi:hypothetical protein